MIISLESFELVRVLHIHKYFTFVKFETHECNVLISTSLHSNKLFQLFSIRYDLSCSNERKIKIFLFLTTFHTYFYCKTNGIDRQTKFPFFLSVSLYELFFVCVVDELVFRDINEFYASQQKDILIENNCCGNN